MVMCTSKILGKASEFSLIRSYPSKNPSLNVLRQRLPGFLTRLVAPSISVITAEITSAALVSIQYIQ